MLGFIETMLMHAQTAMLVWWYVILPIVAIVGCWIYLRRSPHVNFGIARELEEEGDIEKALTYYRRAAENSEGKPEARLAQQKVGEMQEKLYRSGQ